MTPMKNKRKKIGIGLILFGIAVMVFGGTATSAFASLMTNMGAVFVIAAGMVVMAV